MSSSPIPASPIPSRSERRRRTAALSLGLLTSLAASAHETDGDAVPDLRGWRLGVGVAVQAVAEGDAWPVAQRDGVLLTGERNRDRSGQAALEHATAQLSARLDRHWSAELGLGAHDQDTPHLEVARVQLDLPLALRQAGERLRLRAGRQAVPLGAVVNRAGPLDEFAESPLAKLAAVNDVWIDDGLTAQWQPAPSEDEGGASVGLVELGLWRAQRFPAGAGARWSPSLRAAASWGHWRGELAGVWLSPEGRGAAAQGQGAFGHSHGVPDCRISMQQRVCFDGDSRVLAASLSGDSDDGRWQLQLGALWRHEHGRLQTTDGRTDYRGDTLGAWAQLGWQATPVWRMAARLEGLQPEQRLSGPGAALVARSAGFIDVPSRQRAALAVGYSGFAPLSLWLEAGQERSDAPGDARPTYALLRAVWQAPRWLQGGL